MSKFKKTRDTVSREITPQEESIIHAADDHVRTKPTKSKMPEKVISIPFSERGAYLLEKIAAAEERSLRQVARRVLEKGLEELAKKMNLN